MRRVCVGLIIIALTGIAASAIYLAGGFGMSGFMKAEFSLDWRVEIEMTPGGVEICFSPEISGAYDIALFPGEGCRIDSSMLISEDGILAEGADKLSAELTEGNEHTLLVRGTGMCTAELMRRSPGRSIAKAAPITEGEARGIIALEGNAGWFKFTGSGLLTSVWALPGEGIGLDLESVIYNSDGHVVAASEISEGSACGAYFESVKGENYYLRVASPKGGKGMYSVNVFESGSSAPENLDFATGDISMRVGDMRAARARVTPAHSHGGLMWISSNEDIASVSPEGYITAVGTGSADISAFGYGGISHSITVTVVAVEPQDIVYTDEEFSVSMGSRALPHLTVFPMAAAGAGIEYSSADESIAVVDKDGTVTGISMGETVITARWGNLSSSLKVRVEEAPERRRALLIGEQTYAPSVNTIRTGAANTVYNLEALFKTAQFTGGGVCDVRTEMDIGKEEVINIIEEYFAPAGHDDTSIVYITCHGYYRDGESVLQFCDGTEMSASELENVLRCISGTVVLMIDCCDSGGFAGTYESMTEFTGGVMTAFYGGQTPFASSKYKVLASASIGQDSYRIGYGKGENQAATVFGRALCDGLGWDMEASDRGALSADADYDGKITLWETYLYASRRVRWYLEAADGGTGEYAQDVQVYPKGDMFVLFER